MTSQLAAPQTGTFRYHTAVVKCYSFVVFCVQMIQIKSDCYMYTAPDVLPLFSYLLTTSPTNKLVVRSNHCICSLFCYNRCESVKELQFFFFFFWGGGFVKHSPVYDLRKSELASPPLKPAAGRELYARRSRKMGKIGIRHTTTLRLRLRLSSSRSDLHLARSLAVSLASFRSTPSVSRSSFNVSCHVLFGLPTLLLPPSGLHIMARLAGLVVGSRKMCPTNRLRRVATVSCSAACPIRAIASPFVMWSCHEMSKMLLRHQRWTGKHQ